MTYLFVNSCLSWLNRSSQRHDLCDDRRVEIRKVEIVKVRDDCVEGREGAAARFSM